MIIMAVPSPFIRSTAKTDAPITNENQIFVNVAKGIEESTLMTLTDIIKEEIPHVEVAVLSGPSHAEEVGKGMELLRTAKRRMWKCWGGELQKEQAKFH